MAKKVNGKRRRPQSVTYLIDQQASETLEVAVRDPYSTYRPVVLRELVPVAGHERDILVMSREVALKLAEMLQQAAESIPTLQEVKAGNYEYPGMIVR